ncbi:unnamed protein product, partial [Ectocarpus sp. 8 AP-2014]
MRMFDKTLRGYEEAGKWRHALGLLSRMMSDNSSGVRPDSTTFGMVVSACVKAGRWREASNVVLREMPTHGVTPDATTYTSVIDVCGKWGRWEEQVLGLLRRMEETGSVQPSVRSFNIAIKAVGDSGDCEAALALFREMLAAGIVPNMDSYSTVIKAFNQAGR